MRKINYLALGDSYTIGEGVDPESSFPYLLFHIDQEEGYTPGRLEIIATTGWTTGDLITALDKKKDIRDDKWDVITLLIGVNNQYQGKPIDLYKKDFRRLLRSAVALCGGNAKQVIVISIPDYGVTPFAQHMEKNRISREIRDYNAIAAEYATKTGCFFGDITHISKKLSQDKIYLTRDELHPSEKQYKMWIEVLIPLFRKAIENE